ncbi:aminopeptidase [Nanoarchaeota archaeon]
MDSLESLNWMKEVGIYDQAVKYAPRLKKVFLECLPTTSEKVLIIGDIGFQNKYVASIIAGSYYLASQDLNIESKLLFQSPKDRSQNADADVLNALKDLDEKSNIILSMSDKLGNIPFSSFRDFTKKKGHRFISALSLGDLETEKAELVVEPIDIDYKTIQNQIIKFKEKLDIAEEITINTKSGTNLVFNIKGINSVLSHGIYSNPGEGGNLPAGEVFISPNGKRVEGTVVIDGSSRNFEGTKVIQNPITLSIEDGSILTIDGEEEALKLEKSIEWATTLAKNPGGVRRISELGFGFNPKAQIIGSSIVDDKTCNTCHIGVGSNHWFGGSIYAVTHFGQIFKDPKIKIDGKTIKT